MARFHATLNRYCADLTHKNGRCGRAQLLAAGRPWAALLAADITTCGSNVIIVRPRTTPALCITRCASTRFPGSGDSACVRAVSDTQRPPCHTARFTGTLRSISLSREGVDGECVDAFRCALLSAVGIYFQACSFIRLRSRQNVIASYSEIDSGHAPQLENGGRHLAPGRTTSSNAAMFSDWSLSNLKVMGLSCSIIQTGPCSGGTMRAGPAPARPPPAETGCWQGAPVVGGRADRLWYKWNEMR